MKFFSDISAKRNAALAVLLVWLFALISGVANACLLEARETHSHGAAAASVDTKQAFATLIGHAGAVAFESSMGEADLQATCLKVCDDSSRSSPNPVLKVAHTDPGPALVVQVLWSTAAPDVPARRQTDDDPPATTEFPIRVRFSRLAI